MKQPENNDAGADDLKTPGNLDTASAADTGTNNVDEENAGENKPLLLTEPREDTVAIPVSYTHLTLPTNREV